MLADLSWPRPTGGHMGYSGRACFAAHHGGACDAESPHMDRFRCGTLVFVGALIIALLPAAAVAQASPINQFSDSYFTFDVPNGTLSARVNITVQNATAKDLAKISLFAMPKAQDLVVKRGDAVLETKLTPIADAAGLPTLVAVSFDKPLKAKAKAELQMTYTVPNQKSELVHMAPGVMELMLTSQGKGSFVWVDAPQAAENYFDPGCLKAADQPGSVRDAGNERWICGDTLLIALASENKDQLRKCAGADDHCRQRFGNTTPFSAFAQSVTDRSSLATLEADVQLSTKTVKLTLRYFKTDQKWAEKQFAVAQAALPKLEAVFGFPYPHDRALLRESNFIEKAGAAGVAFTDDGDMLLAPNNGIDDEVTVHELSHQWAGRNLETSWLWEGLAEYATRTIAPTMGFVAEDLGWEKLGYKDPLATWWNGSEVRNPYYWYGKAGAFWFAYEKAVGGPEVMKSILSRMDDDPKRLPLDGKWFMDMGEAVSGVNLDSLFLTWVFEANHAAPLIKERRAARDLSTQLAPRAANMGLSGVPTDITTNLEVWAFSGIAVQVAKANALLDTFMLVGQQATDAGLPVTGAMASSWGAETLAQSTARVEDQRQATKAIIEATARLVDQPTESPSMKRLASAREKYAEANFDEAEKLAAGSVTAIVNGATATKLIAAARAKQEQFHPGFFATIGMFFVDPAAELAKAEASLAAGEPELALKQSKQAYDTWQNAERRGLMRLGILAAAMAGLFAGAFWLLKRIDRSEQDFAPVTGAVAGGHVLLPQEERGKWKDWENTGLN